MGKRHSTDICPPENLTVQQNFNLEAYISDEWWVQEQMPTQYLPVEQNYCVRAKYTLGPKNSWGDLWHWDIQVENFSQTQDGTKINSGETLCANQVDGAKLEVAPCFLPPLDVLTGPYWVLEHNEDEGWALISGGEPKREGKNELCVTGSGTNDAGLWIFTRAQQRDEALMNRLKAKLEDKWFDTSVLNPVDNTNCE